MQHNTYNFTGYSDYNDGSYYITILAGMTNMSFSIQIYNDNRIEGYETFNLYIDTSLPYNVRLGSHSRATVTIVDDDCE